MPQIQKPDYSLKLLSRLNNTDYEDSFVRYVSFAALEENSYFGSQTENGFTEKLEGKIVIKSWKEIAVKFPNCVLGEYLLKPDSFSGIVMLNKSLSDENRTKTYLRLLTYFKNRSTLLINKLHGTHGRIFWKNNYEETIVNDVNKLNEVIAFLKNPPKTDKPKLTPSLIFVTLF